MVLTTHAPLLQVGPYAFVSVLLFVIGLTNTCYLLCQRAKSLTTWLMIAILGGFTGSVLTLFVNTALVGWGAAFWPLQDAWVVLCMAAVVRLIYRTPQPERSPEARLAGLLGSCAVLLAWGYSLGYACCFLLGPAPPIAPFYPYFMPLTVLLTLGLALRRIHGVHAARGEARTLCHIAVALGLGLIQGTASALAVAGLLPSPLDTYAISLALLVLMIALVCLSWEHLPQQPSLSVKLVGLTLVTFVTVFGAVGVFEIHAAAVQSDVQRQAETQVARLTVQAADFTALPPALVAIGAPACPTPLLYARSGSGDLSALAEEFCARQAGRPKPPSSWAYYFEYYLMWRSLPRAVAFYFGQQHEGTYHEYVAYPFAAGATPYVAFFRLAEASHPVHVTSLRMIAAALISSLFILVVFPLFFRSSIVAPLEELLRGVRRADAGDLDVVVPVRYADEVGFLTEAFNRMARSLRTSAAEVRALNASLEQRVQDRTRELTVLYEVSAAAHSGELGTMLARALTLTASALHSAAGAILELQGVSGARRLRVLAQHADAADASTAQTLATDETLLQHVLAADGPLLFLNLSTDARVSPALRGLGARALLVAPLRAEAQTWGALALTGTPGQSFTAEEIALLASIADLVTSAMLSDRLRQQTAVLEERARLARDLHDSVTQLLYGLVALTEAGQAGLEAGVPGTVGTALPRIAETARQALNEMRLFVYRLRPPELERQGLVPALQQRLATIELWSGVRVRLQADETLSPPAPVAEALYQIAQEALNNALRHAHAATITLDLHGADGALVMEISDDGCGFDPQSGAQGLGLRHVRERAQAVGGRLSIVTQRGVGTRVSVVVPTPDSA